MDPPERRILDIGCGDGENAEVLSARGHVVTGLTASAAEAATSCPHRRAVHVDDVESRRGVADPRLSNLARRADCSSGGRCSHAILGCRMNSGGRRSRELGIKEECPVRGSVSSVSAETTIGEAEKPHIRIDPARDWLNPNLGELWAYRELLYFLVWRDLKVRYKQTAIGVAWAFVQPVGTMVVFSIFFGLLAKLPSDNLPYPVFYYAGLLPWLYFSGALQRATDTMIEHQRIITKVYFPRLILPLAAVASGLVDFAIAFTVLIAMMAFYGLPAAITIALVPLFLLVAVLTALAVGLWLSALNVMYRDVRYIMPFLIQFWMFASPVVYPMSLLPRGPWRWAYGLNPMAGVIEGFRWAVLGQGLPPVEVGISVGVIVLVLAGGLIFFSRTEGTLVDIV